LKGGGSLARVGDVYFGGLEIRSLVDVPMTETKNQKKSRPLFREEGHFSC